MSEAEEPAPDTAEWSGNYFNYFTEIEEHFRRARGTGLFLLSPLDWALIENWRVSGVPLEAVLKGIDEAFEKWRSRKRKRQLVNSLAYCAQTVLETAHRSATPRAAPSGGSAAPLEVTELEKHLAKAAEAVRQRPEQFFQEISSSLDLLRENAAELANDLEDLERRLSALEEKLVAALRTHAHPEKLYALRERLDLELKPYRGKMSADQLAMLERRYLDTALLEQAHMPRLSLFYIH